MIRVMVHQKMLVRRHCVHADAVVQQLRPHARQAGGEELFHEPQVVFISTNANPSTGAPLISASDGARHYEIFRGSTVDDGQTWQWTAVTRDSTLDNLRPIVPKASAGGRRALLWLRGKYVSYTNYQQELVGVFWKG